MKGHGQGIVQRREEMRDNENDLPIWACKKTRDFHIEVVAGRTFNIYAQIALPMDSFKYIYYTEFIEIHL